MILTSAVLMVRPAAFNYNAETAGNNFFQRKTTLPAAEIQKTAREEFEQALNKLKAAGIVVITIDDTPEPQKPDAIFPNNWFCTLPGKSIQLFPLYATNRRTERRKEIVKQLVELTDAGTIDDWSVYEEAGYFLEGTGSMVFDHEHKTAYAAVSERTDPELFKKFCRASGYTPFIFHAADEFEQPVYHTNVILCLGLQFAVLCAEAVEDAEERQELVNKLKESGFDIITITRKQAQAFAGNMLQLQNENEEPVLVMSNSAFHSLDAETLKKIEDHTRILVIDIPTIESVGGGSIRCMLAELF